MRNLFYFNPEGFFQWKQKWSRIPGLRIVIPTEGRGEVPTPPVPLTPSSDLSISGNYFQIGSKI